MASGPGREISQNELRRDSGKILRAVEHGESFTICRDGRPIGRLIPVRHRAFVAREEVVAAFAGAPVLDGDSFRADSDLIADPDPPTRAW